MCLIGGVGISQADDGQVLNSTVSTELRGLSVVDDRVVWASGAQNTVVRTLDGEHWQTLPAPAGQYDFRDIEAFDQNNAWLMSAGPAAASTLWQTQDGGQSWQLRFSNRDDAGFWDAIGFWDRQRGFIFGDPVQGRFQIWLTQDGGLSWTPSPNDGMPAALAGEGAFAASGTCAVAASGGRLAFVTGSAARARAFVSQDFAQHFIVADLPITVSVASQGAFSIAWLDAQTLLAVGGDYKQPNLAGTNAAISRDGGKTWQPFEFTMPGFLSGVAARNNDIVVTGLAGSAYGQRAAKFTALNATPFNAIQFGQQWIYAAGPKGSLARWKLKE